MPCRVREIRSAPHVAEVAVAHAAPGSIRAALAPPGEFLRAGGMGGEELVDAWGRMDEHLKCWLGSDFLCSVFLETHPQHFSVELDPDWLYTLVCELCQPPFHGQNFYTPWPFFLATSGTGPAQGPT